MSAEPLDPVDPVAPVAPWIGGKRNLARRLIQRGAAAHQTHVSALQQTELVWLEYRHLFAGLPQPKQAFLERRVRVLDGLLATARDEAMDAGFLARYAGNVERVRKRGG